MQSTIKDFAFFMAVSVAFIAMLWLSELRVRHIQKFYHQEVTKRIEEAVDGFPNKMHGAFCKRMYPVLRDI